MFLLFTATRFKQTEQKVDFMHAKFILNKMQYVPQVTKKKPQREIIKAFKK